MKMPPFVSELKRRRVFQAVGIYAVIGWLIIQIVDVVNEPLHLPDWFDTVVILLLLAGFPIAFLLAWVFDITPKGVVRTESESDVTDTAETATGPAPENSLAVLPFENLSSDPDKAYFAAGIHEEILSQLATIKALQVIARTSVRQFASEKKAIPEIAQELNVSAVMEGTVRYDGDRVRINAQLVAADSNSRLWSESYDRQLKDIFAIQTDIATRIAKALTIELSLVEKESLNDYPTDSAEAYEPFLRAMAIYREGDSAVGVTGASGKRLGIQEYLDKALSLDPNFALAHAWKAWFYSYSRAYESVTEENWLSHSARLDNLVREHADKALASNPKLGLAHAAYSKVFLYNWSIGKAEASAEKAMELSPNDSEVLRWCANIKWFSGRQREAVQLAERAVESDPKNGFYHDLLGRTFHSAGNFEDSIAAFQKSVELDPGTAINYISLARPELAAGNKENALEALNVAEKLLSHSGSPALYADLANGFARLGEKQAADRAAEKVFELSGTTFVDPAVRAFALVAKGQNDAAVEQLQKLLDNKALLANPFTLMFIRENGWADPALEQSKFISLRQSLAFDD